jgi:hypothetical protein
MIQIEVLDSPDYDAIGIRTFQFNEIFIGGRKGNVLIGDEKIIDYHFKIEVSESKLVGYLHPDLKTFHLNGKLAQGRVSLKITDKIQIGNSVILLKQAVYQEFKSYKELTNQNLDLLMQKKDPVLEILKKIEKLSHE